MAQPNDQAQPHTEDEQHRPKPGPLGLPDNFDWASFEPDQIVLGSCRVEAVRVAPGVMRLGIKHFAKAQTLCVDMSDAEADRVCSELKPSRVALPDGVNGSGPLVTS
jgi:hypothetical protein